MGDVAVTEAAPPPCGQAHARRGARHTLSRLCTCRVPLARTRSVLEQAGRAPQSLAGSIVSYNARTPRTHLQVGPHTVPESAPAPPCISRQQTIDLFRPLGLPRQCAISQHRVAEAGTDILPDVEDRLLAASLRRAQGIIDPRQGGGRKKVVIDGNALSSAASRTVGTLTKSTLTTW